MCVAAGAHHDKPAGNACRVVMQRSKGLTFHLLSPWVLEQTPWPALLVLGYRRHQHQSRHEDEHCDLHLTCHPLLAQDQPLFDPLMQCKQET